MDEQLKIMCCVATCLVVTLLAIGLTLNSYSTSCINIDSSCTDGSDQKKQLQNAGSGIMAAGAGVALISLLAVMVLKKDDILKAFSSGFGKSLSNGFGSDDFSGGDYGTNNYGTDNSVFD